MPSVELMQAALAGSLKCSEGTLRHVYCSGGEMDCFRRADGDLPFRAYYVTTQKYLDRNPDEAQGREQCGEFQVDAIAFVVLKSEPAA